MQTGRVPPLAGARPLAIGDTGFAARQAPARPRSPPNRELRSLRGRRALSPPRILESLRGTAARGGFRVDGAPRGGASRRFGGGRGTFRRRRTGKPEGLSPGKPAVDGRI
jgi:hypothetical protein